MGSTAAFCRRCHSGVVANRDGQHVYADLPGMPRPCSGVRGCDQGKTCWYVGAVKKLSPLVQPGSSGVGFGLEAAERAPVSIDPSETADPRAGVQQVSRVALLQITLPWLARTEIVHASRKVLKVLYGTALVWAS